MDPKLKSLLIKTFFFSLSIGIAWYLLKGGYFDSWVNTVLPHRFLAEILSGAFYTSFLTSPIAVAMFFVLAKTENPIILSLLAGVGAAALDLIIVKLFRDNLSRDLTLLTRQLKLNLVKKFLKLLKLDFIIPLLGALIIASPLPDELGLYLMGTSELKNYQIIIITYILNTAGILLIVTPINLLS